MEPKFSNQKPPMYQICHDHFGADWDAGTIFAYGDTIYAKHPEHVTKDVLEHEKVHLKQQGLLGKDVWWQLYLTDAKFRTRQEVEAYKVQLEYSRKHYDRHHRKALEKHIYYSFAVLSGGEVRGEKWAKMLLQ